MGPGLITDKIIRQTGFFILRNANPNRPHSLEDSYLTSTTVLISSKLCYIDSPSTLRALLMNTLGNH